MKKIYVVTSIDYGGYDICDISYHLTKKGAMRYIINSNYANWDRCRYIKAGDYEELFLYITEHELYD